VARFIEGLRQANGIIAGISKMHWLRFGEFNALGAALWVALWTTIGYTAGSHIDVLYRELVHYEVYIAVAIVVLILIYVARRLWVHRHAVHRHRGAGEGRDGH